MASPARPGGRTDADKPPKGIEVVRFRAPFVEVGYRQAPPKGDYLRLTFAEKSRRERSRAGLVLAGTVAATVGSMLGMAGGYLLALVGVPVSFAIVITHFGKRKFHVEDGHLTFGTSGLMSPTPTTIDLTELVNVRVTEIANVVAEMADGRKVTVLAPSPSWEVSRYLAKTILSEADHAKGPRGA